jgi:DNA-binding LytR/AlgR family response regulator
LESYIEKTPYLRLSGRCASAFEAMQLLEKEAIDLLFLDIQMPGFSGLQLSRTLRREQRVIFTTAFEQYALEGFKADALDYLLKPFNYDEFLVAAGKARDWFMLKSRAETPRDETEQSIFVKSDYKLIRIRFEDILYIEGLKDYAKFHLENRDRPVMTIRSLTSLEEQLPSGAFMRVHRSYIVHLPKITTIERNRIVFGKTYIPVSEKYQEQFKSFVTKQFFE